MVFPPCLLTENHEEMMLTFFWLQIIDVMSNMLVAATAHGFGKFRARPFLKRGVGLEVLHTRVKKMPFASGEQ